VYALVVFKVFHKLLTILCNYKIFICFFEISYLFWKWFLEPSLEFPFLWLVDALYCIVPTSHWLHGKCARINLAQAASGMILPYHRWLQVNIFRVKIATLGSLKQVTRRMFKICKLIQRSKLKLWVWFFHQLSNQKTLKLSAHVQEVSIYY
jgi:hypothetical protein